MTPNQWLQEIINRVKQCKKSSDIQLERVRSKKKPKARKKARPSKKLKKAA